MWSRSGPGLGVLLCLLSSPPPAGAQPRSLHWRELRVTARLDADGTLQVQERQVMVLSGDWNGGERRFRLRWDHELELFSIEREDTETHSMVPLVEGDLSEVDHYAWHDSSTLRWRSRLPSDPTFRDTEIAYLLHYELSNVLVPTGDGYLLDHDFAFPERDGPILSFSLELSLHPAWKPREELSRRVSTGPLAPGESFVVRVPLSYEGAGRPAAVRAGAGAALRATFAFALLGGAALVGFLFYRGEKSMGRFEPLTPIASIDEPWLREHVFSMLPEEVGAAWDDATAAPEVAAVLARMQAEGKIASEVYRKEGFFSSHQNLRLRLLVDRETLPGYEHSLVKALFVSGDETDTEKIREHYKSRGFDPASKIRRPLERRAKRLLGNARTQREISRRPALLLFFAAALCFGAALLRRPVEIVAIAPLAGALLVLYLVGFGFAAFYRKRVDRLGVSALGFVLPAALLAATVAFVLRFPILRSGTLALAGLVLLALSLLTSLVNAARFRDGVQALELRRRLASARRYFAFELGRPSPRLKDAWFPYLLAFELGPDVDRWFRAFGGSVSPETAGSGSGASSSSSRGTESSSWTGGGGAFGGAGATGSWASAVGAVASGVAAPSSGGSGGGGGGGGSSGGGGGGGW